MSLNNLPGLPQPSTLSSQSSRLSGQVTFPNAYADGCHRFSCPSLLFPFHLVNWNHPVSPGSDCNTLLGYGDSLDFPYPLGDSSQFYSSPHNARYKVITEVLHTFKGK